jgi:hypothetical protein
MLTQESVERVVQEACERALRYEGDSRKSALAWLAGWEEINGLLMEAVQDYPAPLQAALKAGQQMVIAFLHEVSDGDAVAQAEWRALAARWEVGPDGRSARNR